MLLTACHEGRQQLMPMQQTMDSVKMWYGQMQGDSMKVKGEQVAHFLQQHEDDQSSPMRRLRAEWLSIASSTRCRCLTQRVCD